jgi:hypothetical protein
MLERGKEDREIQHQNCLLNTLKSDPVSVTSNMSQIEYTG